MHEVCVLIAAYNAGGWLRQSLAAAVGQRGVDHEVLVVDDGSTDRTGEIAEEFAKAHPALLRCIRLPRSGLSKARNVGFDAADAEFVTVLDADDRMHPERARVEVEGLRRYPEAAFCLSARWNFSGETRPGFISFRPEDLVGTDAPGLYLIEDPLTVLLETGHYPGTSACSSRLEFVRTVGRYDEDQPSFVDGELWIRVVHHRPVAYCSVPLYYRRVHEQSLSGTHPARVLNVFRAMGKARAHWDDYSPRQQQLLAAFEKRAAVGFAKKLIEQGKPRQARALLREHRDRLKGSYWRKVWLSSFLPSPLLKALKGARARTRRKQRTIPREEIQSLRPVELLGLGPPAQGRDA